VGHKIYGLLSMKKERLRILFTTPEIQHPPAGGPYLRIENSIKALGQIAELYLHARVTRRFIGGRKAIRFYQNLSRGFTIGKFGITPFFLFLCARVFNKLCRLTLKRALLPIDKWMKESEHKRVLRLAKKHKVDLIWLGYGNISYDLLKYLKENSQYRIVLDTDSVWSRFVLRGIEYAENEADRERILQSGHQKQEEERWGTANADVTTAVSEVDAEYYRSLISDPTRVQIFSNVIDVASYENPPPRPDGFRSPCIYLAGYFGPKSPMDDAARWFLNNVWPQLTARFPDLHFYIVGKGSRETLKDIQHPGVTITGQLDSVLPYLCNADISLVPLRFESGTRFKILEAGACGIPIVSTTLGAEGISVTHGQDIWIADTPDEFLTGISKLLSDRDFALNMANKLKETIQEKYGLSKLRSEGELILQHLTRQAKEIG